MRVQAPVELVRASQRGGDHHFDLLRREAVCGAYVDAAARRDRAERVLGLEGMADLAYGERVERQVERRCDLRGHGHPPAREPDHHAVAGPLPLERGGEEPPRLTAVAERQAGAHAGVISP